MDTSKLERVIERVVLTSRWILVVFYLGLAASLGIYAISFALKLVKLAEMSLSSSEAEMILAMLGLIDAALVASLVVMVMLSGYENFVSRFQADGREDLTWLNKLGAGSLKVKVASAIVAISSIHLLQVFLNVENYDPARVEQLTFIHLAFIISALILAVLDWIMARSVAPAVEAAEAAKAKANASASTGASAEAPRREAE
ncbi:MAG: TIGR00645 family protein [Pseudomonadota bacterium]